MCGIAGFSGDFDPQILSDMGAAIAHRGPDDSGEACFRAEGNRVGLANRRLAIVDLRPSGHQPMTLKCPVCGEARDGDEDKLWLAYNGEIYNFPDLRKDLERSGHHFFSNTDSEVILHLYAQHGAGMLPRLNGIFALAIYDGRKRRGGDDLERGDVLLARDGVGVKPLYYSESRRGVLFASEMKALLACPEALVERRLDPIAVDQYLAYQWVPAPRTVLETVRKVLPGEYLVLRKGRIHSRTNFYRLPVDSPDSSWSFGELKAAFTKKLESAVSRQMISDVPVGAFLSGGLDSSAVVAMVRQAQPSYRLPCYTMIFDESFSPEGSPSDFPFAKKAAKHLGVELIPVQAGAESVDRLEEVLYSLDEPTGDPAALNAFLISERARADGIKVLLSGTGGDDTLGGYPRNLTVGIDPIVDAAPVVLRGIIASAARHLKIPGKVRALLMSLDQPRERRWIARYQSTTPALRSELLGTPWRAQVPPGSDFAPLEETLSRLPREVSRLARVLQLEQRHFLADHNLNYLDKTTMAFGVEGRVPLLDLELLEFLATVPARFKVRGWTGKYLLKKAMEPLLPREIIYRKKTGFGVPLRQWLKGGLGPKIREALSPGAVRDRGVFDDRAVQSVLERAWAGDRSGTYTAFSLFAFETWCRRFLDFRASTLKKVASR